MLRIGILAVLRKSRKIKYLPIERYHSTQNGWALKALIPWFVAGGLLVSFTASAGYAPPDFSSDVTGSLPKSSTSQDTSQPATLASFNEAPVTLTKVLPSNSLLFDP